MQSTLIGDAGDRDVLLVPQSSSRSGATLLVASLVDPAGSDRTLHWSNGQVSGVAAGGTELGLSALEWQPWPTRDVEPLLWWARVNLVSDPGQPVEIAVLDADGGELATATTFTLPTRLADFAGGRGIRLRASSCFDQGRYHGRPADAVVANRLGADEGGPVVSFMLGDQVYLDAPIWDLGKADRSDAEVHNVRKYVKSFGPTGLGRALTAGPNFFLADDHEIWNDFPHPTALLTQSMHEKLDLPWITSDEVNQFRPKRRERFWLGLADSAGRILRFVRRDRSPGSTRLPDAGPPEDDATRWMYSALDLYSIFQTPDENPLTADPPGEWRPTTVRHAALAEGIDVVLVDTRRMRQYKTEGRSLLLAEQDADRAVHLIRTAGADASDGSPRLLILAFAEPLVGHRRTRALASPWQRAKRFVLGTTDHSITQYADYPKLIDAVAERAAAGLPTLLLGGDVHHSLVAKGRGDRVVEVTSSPLALVRGLRPSKKSVEPHAEGYRFIGQARRERSQYAEIQLGMSATGNNLEITVQEFAIDTETWRVREEHRTVLSVSPGGVLEDA